MPQERNKTVIAVCWVLVAVCMVLIFYFSSRTSVESAQQSAGVLNWITRIFGENAFTDFIVRKTAHCLEFTGLALLFNIALYFTCIKIKPIQSIIFTSLYAVTDEVHQIFVDGRSCELRDWAIDTAGALIGTIGFLIIYVIIKKAVEKRKRIDTALK
ncbi:MAG: VanZ family protein [Eubacterium sp.]